MKRPSNWTAATRHAPNRVSGNSVLCSTAIPANASPAAMIASWFHSGLCRLLAIAVLLSVMSASYRYWISGAAAIRRIQEFYRRMTPILLEMMSITG